MSSSFDPQKAIFLGKFIDIAFGMFIPGVTNPKQRDFPIGWKLVKNITIEVAAAQKEFIGFVAQSLDEPSKFTVILHGTEGAADFIKELDFEMIDFNLVPNGGKTEYGFTKIYESFSFVDPMSGVSQSLQDYLNELGLNQTASFTVAGHSLGGALATLHSLVLVSRNIQVAEVYTFASPMVGNNKFVNTYNSLVPNSYRIVNKPDVVPLLPGKFLGYQHVNTLININSISLPNIKRNIICFHSLDVYLYALGATNTNLGSCKANYN